MAAVGSSFTPDYASLAEIDFPLGTTDFYGFFDVTTDGGPGTSANAARFNDVGNFVFDFDPVDLSSVTVTFPTPITGFAGLWSNTFVQDGMRVSTPLNDYDLNALAAPLDAAFIGITEASPFDSIRFSTSENIPGDDFVFFRELTYAPVPEPHLWGSGLCWLMWMVGGRSPFRAKRG